MITEFNKNKVFVERQKWKIILKFIIIFNTENEINLINLILSYSVILCIIISRSFVYP